MGLGRRGKHRYSRSLTDAPLPVPIPPGVTNNASNRYTGYSPSPSPSGHVRERARSLASEPDDDETPRRRPDGGFASYSASMGPPATPMTIGRKTDLSLPDDPKSWSTAQVAGYLTAVSRDGGMEDVARAMTKFVNENQVAGKAFLRLSETDLARCVSVRCHRCLSFVSISAGALGAYMRLFLP